MADDGEWLLRARSRWQEGTRRSSLRAIDAAHRILGERRTATLARRAEIVLRNGPCAGRDGFLFHREHDVFDQLAGRIVLERSQLRTWLDAFERRLDWCRRHHAAMRFLVVPEKHVVYRDVLPRGATISPKRQAMRLFAAMDDEMRSRTLYPRAELEAASALMPTYFRTDTHWTDYGALIAYWALVESLASEIALETINEATMFWRPVRYIGDLGVCYEPERGETRFLAAFPFDHRIVYQNNRFERGAVHVYSRPRTDLPTCVMFRDSFANFMIPFLMRSFSRIVSVSSLSCHYDLLERERPDVVLFMTIERFLANYGRGTTIELPRDGELQPFAAFCGTPLDNIPAPPHRAARPQSTEISAAPATAML